MCVAQHTTECEEHKQAECRQGRHWQYACGVCAADGAVVNGVVCVTPGCSGRTCLHTTAVWRDREDEWLVLWGSAAADRLNRICQVTAGRGLRLFKDFKGE